jgi:protein-disulfide isomerase
VADKSKRPPRIDLKNPDGKFGRLVQIGGTAIVVIFAVVLVFYIVTSHHDKKNSAPVNGQGDTVRVTSSKLVTKPGTTEPKAVVTLYEDFLCPICADFERKFGPTVSKLIDIGAIAADYSMLAILDHPPFNPSRDYSSRAGAAARCVADESTEAFRRFHSELFDPNLQPAENARSYPDNKWLIERARQAGVDVGPGSKVADCINSGKYVDVVAAEAKLVGVDGTPAIRINGEEYEYSHSTPQDLVAKIKGIVGDVPGIDTAVAPAAS